MTPSEFRILFGCLWAAAGCLVAIGVGDRPERRAAILVAVCWVATTAVQFLIRRVFEPVLLGDFAYGLGLLWLASRYNRMWIWLMIALQAAVFFLHAWLYQAQKPPGLAHLILNNLIALGSPAVLVVVALTSRHRRRANARWRTPTFQVRDSGRGPWVQSRQADGR
jgi:type IV secretory pathway TraG/TraD family ATPase VirD4